VTGATTSADRVRCLDAGMDACVAKPIDPAELYATLAQVLPAAAATPGAQAA
jgi:DNA-binding response OmpR family regulator